MKFFLPDLQIRSILSLNLDLLHKLGLNALILDIDNTLKPYHASQFSDEVKCWATGLQNAGISLLLASNGKYDRIAKLGEQIGLPFISNALKPMPFRIRSFGRKKALSPHKTAFVGDQLFSDVLAGNLAGFYTILVTPVSSQDPWFTGIKRPIERFVLRRYLRKENSESNISNVFKNQ
jgi:HAD superfamily phosphatase (TIGR01668 family)